MTAEVQILAAVLTGAVSGFSAGIAAVRVLRAELAPVKATTDRLAAAVEGEDGLQVRVALLERSNGTL